MISGTISRDFGVIAVQKHSLKKSVKTWQDRLYITSDMFDLEDVIDPALLSSTSPSSDSMDMPLLVAVADEESIETLSGLWPPFPAETEFEPEPAVELSGSRLRPTDDSLRNCSRNDI